MTPDEITAQVQAGAITHQQAIQLFAALYGQSRPSSDLRLPCEACGQLAPLSHLVSYKLWVAMPGHPDVAGFDGHDQHFCCSHACAAQSVATCLARHLRPEAERRVAAARDAEAQRRAGVQEE